MDGLGILRAGGHGGKRGSIAASGRFRLSIGMVWVLQVGLHMVCGLFLMNQGLPLTSGNGWSQWNQPLAITCNQMSGSFVSCIR